jgi:hypothetical protein
MKVTFPTIKYDDSRDTYWAKVKITSEKEDKATMLLFCASYEYVGEELKITNEEKIRKWFNNDILKNLTEKGDVIFRKPYHFDVRAVTSEGYTNGLTFLQNQLA